MNDEGRLHSALASNTPAADDTETSGRDYPRCDSCGRRFPGEDLLERHLLRSCLGPVDVRRVVVRRLRPNERAAFKRQLRR